MDDWVANLLTLLGVILGGGGAAWFLVRANQQKLEAEARSIGADYGAKVTASAIALINELQAEMTDLRQRQQAWDSERVTERAELRRLRTELDDANRKVSNLTAEVGRLSETVTQLQKQLTQQRNTIRQLQGRNTALESGVASLTEQLRDMRVEPAWGNGS